jgi:hypothetical protein
MAPMFENLGELLKLNFINFGFKIEYWVKSRFPQTIFFDIYCRNSLYKKRSTEEQFHVILIEHLR